jgi:outer membrane protein, heavy metal efflux system
MNYRFTLSLILLLPVILAAPAFAGHAGPAENLAELIDKAVSDNPEVKASEARWRMFKSKIVQARSLEDPMLMLKLQNGMVKDPLNFEDPMTQKVIGITQQLPFFGKRDLKAEVARREADSYKWQVEERKLELRRMVTETYYQIYTVDHQKEILQRNIAIMDLFINLAETKYAVGQGAQQDIFKAQVERSRMLEMGINLDQQRKTLQANLNALLYRPADTPVGKVHDPELKQVKLTAAELTEMAFENRPLLKSLKSQIEKGRASQRLARSEIYPDFNVSFEYMQRDKSEMSTGDDMYSLGVTFNLPIQAQRRQAMVAEASSEVNMAAEELNAAKNTIESGIADLLAQLERRKKLVDLYKTGIIPQAQQSLESATIGYRVNKADFLMLQDNRLTLYNFEHELYDSMADYMMRLAQLEALVGQPLQ